MVTNYDMLVTQNIGRSKKDERQRMTYYVEWLGETDRAWYLPDLDAYRDYLLEYRKLEPSSAMAHISTVKARYKNLLRDHQHLVSVLHQVASSIEEQPTFVSETLKVIEQATKTDAGKIEFERDIRVFHLTRRQIDRLLVQPNTSTAQGLRDVTAIGLMYCVGISETELCSLQVSDLDQEKSGEPAIHVPETAGGTERVVRLYDDLVFTEKWLQRYIKAMMDATLVSDGYVFRGFFRGGERVKGNSLSPRAVQKMLKGYPIQDAEGHEITVTALDLRRTYARQLFQEGVTFDDIHRNLGNVNKRTTMEYIGLPQKENPENYELGDASILLSKLRERRGY